MYAKRWVSFALAAVMAAGILAGCDGQQGGDSSSSSSSSSSSQVSGGGSGGSGGDHSNGGSSHETAKSYTVTAVIGEGGAVTCNKQQVESGDSFKNVPADTKVTFTVTPDDGYEIADVIATGGTLTSDGKGNYTLTVTANCTVSITFAGILRDVEFEPINGQPFDAFLLNELKKAGSSSIETIDTQGSDAEVLNFILRDTLLTNNAIAKIEVLRDIIATTLLNDYLDNYEDERPLYAGAERLKYLKSENGGSCFYLELFDTTDSETLKTAIVQQLHSLPSAPTYSDYLGTDEWYSYDVVLNGVTVGNKGYTVMLVAKYRNNIVSPSID